MINKKTFLLCLVVGLTGMATLQAQTTFEVTQKVELKTQEDYPKYEAAVIEAAKWLEETDLDKELTKRQQVNAFVLQWVSGSPTITVEINPQIAKIYGKNVQLLGIYLASYTKYYLENKGTADKFSAIKAGIISMMNVYKKGIDIKKSKEMEKLIKLTNNNKLDDYIKENLS